MPRFLNPNPVFFDEDVFQPARGFYLFFFENRTNNPKAVYAELTENTIVNDGTGAVRLDQDGRLPVSVFYTGLATVELRRTTATGSTVWRLDDIEAAGGGGSGGSSPTGQYYEFRYTRAATQPATPSGDTPIGWAVEPPADDGTPLWMIQGLKLITTGGLIGAWSTPVQITGDPGTSGVLVVEYSANGTTGWHGPPFQPGVDQYMRQDLGSGFGPAIKIVGEDGSDGPYYSFLFQRASSQPATPPAGDPAPAGWFDAPPTTPAASPLWMTFARLSADGGTVLVAWSVPVNVKGDDGLPGADGEALTVEYSPNGVDSWHAPPFVAGDRYMRQKLGAGSFGPPILILGEDGSNGPFTDFVFRRSPTQPATPTEANPAGWFDGPPAGTDPLWVTTALKQDASTLLSAWSTPQQLSGPPGAAGDPGADGTSPVIIFIESATQPATPTGNTPAGWSEAPPGNPTNPIWFSRNTKNSAGDVIGPWTVPVQFTGDGLFIQYSANQTGPWHDPPFIAGSDRYARTKQGANGVWSTGFLIVGENGVNGEFFDFRFRRATTQPATPTGNNPTGWFDDPALATGTGKLWMTKGRKTAQGNLIGTWSVPIQLEGSDGAPGDDGAPGGGVVRLTDSAGVSGNDGSITFNSNGTKVVISVQGFFSGIASGSPPASANFRVRRNGTIVLDVAVNIAFTGAPFNAWNITPVSTAANFVGEDTPPTGPVTYTTEWTAGATALFTANIPILTVEQIQ